MKIKERLAIIDNLIIINSINYLIKRNLLHKATKFRVINETNPAYIRVYSSFDDRTISTIKQCFYQNGLPETINIELMTFQDYINEEIVKISNSEILQTLVKTSKYKEIITNIREHYKIVDTSELETTLEQEIAEETLYPFDSLEQIISKKDISEEAFESFEIFESKLEKKFEGNLPHILNLLKQRLKEVPLPLLNYTRYYALLGIKTSLNITKLNAQPLITTKSENGNEYLEIRVYKNTNLVDIEKSIRSKVKMLQGFTVNPHLKTYKKGLFYAYLSRLGLPEECILDYLKVCGLGTDEEHKSRDIKRFLKGFFN